MAYIYVKSGGTATGTAGKYADAKTGSWSTAFTDPSQYYGNIRDSISSSVPSNSDFIIVSNIHDYTYTIPASTSWYVGSNLSNLRVVSVDDTNISVALVGAREVGNVTTASYTFGIAFAYCYGLIWESNVNASFAITGTVIPIYYPLYQTYEKCTFRTSANSSYNYSIKTYYNAKFIDCIFDVDYSSVSGKYKIIDEAYGHRSHKNCTFIAKTSSAEIDTLFGSNTSHSYTYSTEFDGCDFSQADRILFNPTTYNLYSIGGITRVVTRCAEATNNRYPAYLTLYLTNSGFSLSGSNKNSIKQYYPSASTEIISSVYRNDGGTDGINYYSVKVITSATYPCTASSPFTFKLADFYLDTSTTKTFTVELLQENGSTPLTDYQFSIDVYHIKSDSFKATRESTTKILPSTNDLSTSSKTWTGLTDPVKQYISLTTSEIGSYGLCSVYVNIFVPNRTIYICPKIDIT